MIDEADKKIISLVQRDIPVTSRPFADLADAIGIPEEDFINRLMRLKNQGIMRRFGATLRHQEAGFSSNAMVAWVVPDDRVEEVGKRLADFREVTHCYQRMPKKDWPYNLYTMVHGSNRDQCHETAKIMASTAGMDEYTLLFSEKEFKKTSMEYF